jgi:hypothetical protein
MTRSAILIAGGLALASYQAAAQGANSPAPPPDALPYAMPMTVPANGCAWGGLVYSDGAVIQGRLAVATVFRCASGSWESFNSAQQAIDRSRSQEASGSSQPRR